MPTPTPYPVPPVLPVVDWAAFDLSGVVIAAIGVIGTIVTTILIRRSRRTEVDQEEAADGFAQLDQLAARQAAEITRITAERDAERAGRRADAEYAEARWTRQIERCRRITDSATVTIARLTAAAGRGPEQIAGRRALTALELHSEEHPDALDVVDQDDDGA